jgi:nitrite reductase/ring-hydroxylating ferredoxin subunit
MSDDFVFFAKQADIPPGRMLGREIDGVPVLVANLSGDFVAVKDVCPHQGTPLHDGSIHNGAVVCRKHAWPFDLRTGCYLRIPQIKIKCYEVKVEGEDVLVKVYKETMYA